MSTFLCYSKLLTKVGKTGVNIYKYNNTTRYSHGHWSYRTKGPRNKAFIYTASELIMGFAWWWVLWHIFDEYEHITGEWEYPDAYKWTDEELGIPKEDDLNKAMKK